MSLVLHSIKKNFLADSTEVIKFHTHQNSASTNLHDEGGGDNWCDSQLHEGTCRGSSELQREREGGVAHTSVRGHDDSHPIERVSTV